MLMPTADLERRAVGTGHALERLHDAQPGAHGALGVVLVGGGHAEDANDGVADELLDGAAVGLDRFGGAGEVLAEQAVHVLGVGGFAHGGEGDEVAEQGGDDLALFGVSDGRDKRRSALHAESRIIGPLPTTGGAGDHVASAGLTPRVASTASVSAIAGFAPSRAKISRAAARGAAASGALSSATRQRPWPSSAWASS